MGDHLGSTSVTADASGAFQSEMRYTAFGETRSSTGPTPTDYQYTGQRHEAEFGLYFYKARWYDPALAHFTQPDTIIPGAGNPMALDRYAYVMNNSLRYTDPSGNMPCPPTGPCGSTGSSTNYYSLYGSDDPILYVVLGGFGDGGETAMGPDPNEQAPVWVTPTSINVKYPGVDKIPGYDGKLGQAKKARSLIIQRLQETEGSKYDEIIIVGLSAGADAGLILADMLANDPSSLDGVPVTNLIMLGPTFTGGSENEKNLDDVKNTQVMFDNITSSGTNVLIVNDAAPDNDWPNSHDNYEPAGTGSFNLLHKPSWGHVDKTNYGLGVIPHSGFVNNDSYIYHEIMSLIK